MNLEDFFGKSPIQQKPQTIVKKTKKEESKTQSGSTKDKKHKSRKEKNKKESKEASSAEVSFECDDEFEATLMQIDDEQLQGLSTTIASPQISRKKGLPQEKFQEKKHKTPEKEKSAEIKIEHKTPVSADPKAGRIGLLDSDQKRKQAELYQRYLNRSGPKNPGSKKIPKVNAA